jgi:alkylation response protein AidB-like acyl-CoA dehydrogenase
MAMNHFRDNPDLVHHISRAIPWDQIVPLWEDGFRGADGPKSVAEARELYEASLTEVGEFAAREIAPTAREIDETGVRFENGQVVQPAALLRNVEGLRKLGALAPSLPREVGGLGFPMSVGAAMLEVVGRACTNTMILYAFYQGPALMILRFGTPDQIERWVKPLADGRMSGAVAITEPDVGSDIAKIAARATPDGDGWRIDGTKQFITNGCGDVCIVVARSEQAAGFGGLSLFVVPRRLDGRDNYRVAKPEKKFVIRGSATCELAFEGSQAELLGARGRGFAQILTFMNEARVAVAVQGLGLAQAALDDATAYAARRVQMDRPIARHELVADLLLDMRAEVAAMRALVYRVTALQDRLIGLERAAGHGSAREIARLQRAVRDRTPLVKWLGSERTLWVTRAAVQVHGGYGVVQEYDVERHYRNALILPIYEGTSQIQALMSLKDQARWALERPWRLFSGSVSVEAPGDLLGDAVREMAGEYSRALRFALFESAGALGVIGGLAGRPLPKEGLGYALLSAERLCAMLAHTRAAEALLAATCGDAARRKLAERYVHRTLPLVRMHGEIVRSGDRSTLEAIAG